MRMCRYSWRQPVALPQFALGHGISDDVTDVVCRKRMNFGHEQSRHRRWYRTHQQKFLGFSRRITFLWVRALGFQWLMARHTCEGPHISAARVIVEVALKNYRWTPNQNALLPKPLRVSGLAISIDTNTNDGLFRKDILDNMPAVEETQYVRHVCFDRPLKIMMDGKEAGGVLSYWSDNAKIWFDGCALDIVWCWGAFFVQNSQNAVKRNKSLI